jgi:hypothetical protein
MTTLTEGVTRPCTGTVIGLWLLPGRLRFSRRGWGEIGQRT